MAVAVAVGKTRAVAFLLVHRNKYSEGMDDGQKNPRGHPDFHSYVKIQCVFIFQTYWEFSHSVKEYI